MNRTKTQKQKIAVSLALAASLALAGSASAALVITTDNEQGAANTWPFTPSWTPAANSLILRSNPVVAVGNFAFELTTRNVSSLTAGGSLTIDKVTGDADDAIGSPTTCTNYVTCGNGNGAGSLLVYTLPTGAANGFNLTNITVYGGWADSGRDGQAFTVLYSTKAKPDDFIHLATVNYNPSVPSDTASANREIISDSSGGVIAANAAAVKFVFNFPGSENGTVGYGAITVQGTAAPSVVSPVVSITTTNESGDSPFTPDWTVETPSLIAGMEPTAVTGDLTLEGAGGAPVLTDGAVGASGNISGFATCGGWNNPAAGQTLIYTLTNSPNGSDVTNIVVYSGWGNGGRDGQYYTLSYSTVSAPTTYNPIASVYYLPSFAGAAPANRVTIAMNNGAPLGSGVANIKFDFVSLPNAGDFNNGYQGYSEIIVQGTNTTAPPPPPSPLLVQNTRPTRVETVIGDQVVFTAAYSNSPPANLQWMVISNGVTNAIAGATSTTLTLNNVQLTNSGSYLLKAVNATNGLAAPSYSAAAPLAVSTPATVGNVIVKFAGQAGPTGFYPAWTIATNLDLIFGFPTDGSGNPGTATAGTGNFALEAGLNADPTILADGILGGDKASMVSAGWVNSGAGVSMTYTLPTTVNGYNITNITVYGAWPDDGRNEQKYSVLYSTVSAPTTFVGIGTFDYNPSFTSGEPNSTRVTLVPVTGALAQNVAAVQINFNMTSKNNWNGYSEITIHGTPALGVIPSLTQDITPLTARDVVGSALTLMGNFTGATDYQWQKNGTNIAGATTTTLTLNNLQLADTATNGGYRLLGINAAGTNATRGCSAIVDPAPAAVSNVITSFAYQTSDAGAANPFGPTWDTSALGSSLIAGQNPPSAGYGPGSFTGGGDAGTGLPALTDGNYGVFAYDTTHPAFACAGPTAGQFVIYALGENANGYDVTNIVIAGGWNDNGRNSQVYTVSYSTVANPLHFIPIKAVNNRPTFPSQSVIRTTIKPATGVLASGVYALKVDFTSPGGVPNGYSGYSEISIFGSPSAPSTPTIGSSAANEWMTAATPPSWVIETNSLIAGRAPSAVGAGNFQNEAGVAGTVALTDGIFGNADAASSYATCGNNAGRSVTYASANGWNLTNIVVYSGWGNYNRDGQFYNVTYSTMAEPTTFVPLTSVFYDPLDLGGVSANRVDIAPINGAATLATSVYAIRFDFTPQIGALDNGYSGYAEIVLQGISLDPPIPPVVNMPRSSGGNLILTGAGGTPNRAYTWVTTTNVLIPLASWTVSSTGVTDATGSFSNAIPVNVSQPGNYFRLRMP